MTATHTTYQPIVLFDTPTTPLMRAVAEYLARYTGQTRSHTQSDLRICEACGANIEDLGAEHGHRVLKVRGKGGKVVQTPLPPAVQRAIERAIDGRTTGLILRCTRGTRMDRHSATRRLRALATTAGVTTARMYPHMLRHTFVTTMGAVPSVQIFARGA